MKLKNIGKIDYEIGHRRRTGENNTINKHTPDNIWALRCPFPTPTDFRQKLLTDIYGEEFIDKSKKVLEIGFGCGRNAQFFMNETNNIDYYGFDISAVGFKHFNAQGFPKDRYYISLDIDEKILSQKYDLIFSTFVFHHIGFNSDESVYDANRITQKLLPTLKNGGYWVSYEGRTGDNGWRCPPWYETCFSHNKQMELMYDKPAILLGSSIAAGHELYILRKNEKLKKA